MMSETSLPTSNWSPDPRRRRATILFCDVMNSAHISDNLTMTEYDEFLMDFQKTCRGVVTEAMAEIPAADYAYMLRGDELFLIIYHKLGEDVKLALEIAGALKARWLLHWRNRARIDAGKEIWDVGIGMHTGDVVVDYHMVEDHSHKTAEGFAINLAKRIEGASREGRFTRVMVSQEFFWEVRDLGLGVTFSGKLVEQLKGIAQRTVLYEIKCFLEERTARLGDTYHPEDIDLLTKAFLKNPFNLWLGIKLAIYAYYDLKDFSLALRVLDRFLEIEDQVAVAHMIRGDIYWERGNHQQAFRSYQSALEIEPLNTTAWLNLALYYGREGNLTKEIECYQKVVELDAQDYKSCNNLGVCFDRMGDLDRAIEFYRRATEINPDYAKAWFNLGVAYGKRDRLPQSNESLQKACALSPGYMRAWVNLAANFRRMGDWVAAIKTYYAAIEIDPTHPKNYLYLAEVLFASSKFPEAISTCSKSLEFATRDNDRVICQVYRSIAKILADQWDNAERQQLLVVLRSAASVESLNWNFTELERILSKLALSSDKINQIVQLLKIIKKQASLDSLFANLPQEGGKPAPRE